MKRQDRSHRANIHKAAGTISPRDDQGALFNLFKARSPLQENLRFEKKRVPLFDAKIPRNSQTSEKTPFSRDNFV